MPLLESPEYVKPQSPAELADRLFFRDDMVRTGKWTQDQSDEWGHMDDLQISRFSDEERQELETRIQEIRAERRGQWEKDNLRIGGDK